MIILHKKETQHNFMYIMFKINHICFKKMKYTTHYLVVKDENLPGFLTWFTHNSAYDPFLHVALPKRVDPRVHPLTDVTHLWPLGPNA